MPRNDEYSPRHSAGITAGEAGSADDFIARLVGEIVDSAGGQVADHDGELSTIERRLAALREEEANPPPALEPARPAAPPVQTVPSVAPVRALTKQEPPSRREQGNSLVVRRGLSSEERLAALRALSDDLTEAETALRTREAEPRPLVSEVVAPERRRSQPPGTVASIDDVIVDAARASGAEPEFVAGGFRSYQHRRSPWLTAVLSLVIVLLSGLLALSWLSPTGARGLLDGSVWRQAVALLGGADDIAVQTIAVADVSCDPAAGDIGAQQSLAQAGLPALASPAEPAVGTPTAAVEPLSHGLRIVKTYRVGPDGRVEVPGVQATIPSRQALAEHGGNY